MFGLSWAQITIIVLVGVFVLGPERIPTAVRWVTDGLRKLRTMAAGAQAQLNREIGPELDELRRQIADLQSLKEIQDLKDLRDLHPKRLIGNTILGEEFTGGGIGGFLGLRGASPTGAAAPGAAPAGPTPVKPVSATPPSAPTEPAVPAAGAVPSPAPAAGASAPTAPADRPRPSPAPAARSLSTPASAARPAVSPVRAAVGVTAGRLAAPKVVGAPRRVPVAPPPARLVAGFDVDAT